MSPINGNLRVLIHILDFVRLTCIIRNVVPNDQENVYGTIAIRMIFSVFLII